MISSKHNTRRHILSAALIVAALGASGGASAMVDHVGDRSDLSGGSIHDGVTVNLGRVGQAALQPKASRATLDYQEAGHVGRLPLQVKDGDQFVVEK
ncbi:MAG: hypothetical protein U5K73_02400 [Halofilum sp. (in: g-proteobacteria)]|nr:hypothetical protein [Halofilum sp. (in: g-proteobacteria)]